MEKQQYKTKWQELLETQKGGLEYNPNQTFALQVFWVVRSPTSAREMIEKGFSPCSKATLRDTPTTPLYFFRISRDQKLAAKYKSEIKTISQHPHYQPAFKSLQMGIQKNAVEFKLKNGGIDVGPLSWGADELIESHKELDFDPVVLECTEVYLDNGGFWQHILSKDWMKSLPEIMKPSRSLKPTTFCVGTPTADVVAKSLDSLNAIHFIPDKNKLAKAIEPNVIFKKFDNNNESEFIFFLELDLLIQNDKLQICRSHFSKMQEELEAPILIVLPTNIHDGSPDDVEVRVMFSFPYLKTTKVPTFENLAIDCKQVEGQVIVFEKDLGLTEADPSEKILQRGEAAHGFVSSLKCTKISILDGHKAQKSGELAGYPLHPLFRKIMKNEKYDYHM